MIQDLRIPATVRNGLRGLGVRRERARPLNKKTKKVFQGLTSREEQPLLRESRVLIGSVLRNRSRTIGTRSLSREGPGAELVSTGANLGSLGGHAGEKFEITSAASSLINVSDFNCSLHLLALI